MSTRLQCQKLLLVGMIMFLLVGDLFAQSSDTPKPDPKKFFPSLSFPFMQLYHYYPDSIGSKEPVAKVAFPAGIGFMYNYVLCKNFLLNIPVLLKVDKNFDVFNISTGISISSILFGSKVVGIGLGVDIIRKQDNGYEMGLFSEKNKKLNYSLFFQFGFPVFYESLEDMIEKELAKVKELEHKDPKKAKKALIKAFKFKIQEDKEKGNLEKVESYEEKLKEVIKKPAEEAIIRENREYLQPL